MTIRIDISKYLNIPFKDFGHDFSGVDCLGIVRLFFKNEFNFYIPEFEYESEWKIIKQNPIENNYAAVCEKIKTPTRYGIVGFRMPGYFVEHHLGIILYDLDQFLHSPLNKPSCVSKLSHPVWKRSVNAFYKVKGLDIK